MHLLSGLDLPGLVALVSVRPVVKLILGLVALGRCKRDDIPDTMRAITGKDHRCHRTQVLIGGVSNVEKELAELRQEWGQYRIWVNGETWYASRGTSNPIMAASSQQLRNALHADHLDWVMRRQG